MARRPQARLAFERQLVFVDFPPESADRSALAVELRPKIQLRADQSVIVERTEIVPPEQVEVRTDGRAATGGVTWAASAGALSVGLLDRGEEQEQRQQYLDGEPWHFVASPDWNWRQVGKHACEVHRGQGQYKRTSTHRQSIRNHPTVGPSAIGPGQVQPCSLAASQPPDDREDATRRKSFTILDL